MVDFFCFAITRQIRVFIFFFPGTWIINEKIDGILLLLSFLIDRLLNVLLMKLICVAVYGCHKFLLKGYELIVGFSLQLTMNF